MTFEKDLPMEQRGRKMEIQVYKKYTREPVEAQMGNRGKCGAATKPFPFQKELNALLAHLISSAGVEGADLSPPGRNKGETGVYHENLSKTGPTRNNRRESKTARVLGDPGGRQD